MLFLIVPSRALINASLAGPSSGTTTLVVNVCLTITSYIVVVVVLVYSTSTVSVPGGNVGEVEGGFDGSSLGPWEGFRDGA